MAAFGSQSASLIDVDSLRMDGQSAPCSQEIVDQIEQEIDNLDKELNKYYFMARENVPDIVTTESDPRKFLMVSDGNVLLAAEKLALYWKERSDFFGDRWLLPMTQTGTGCLTRQDVEVLITGYLAIITLQDRRQVSIVDPSRIGRKLEAGTRERLMFYLATNIFNDRARIEGVECVMLAGQDGPAVDFCMPELLARVYGCLPYKKKSVTVIQLPTEGKECLIDYHVFTVVRTHEVILPGVKDVATAASPMQAMKRLKEKGIKRMYLPSHAGGNPMFGAHFASWIRQRLSVEEVMSGAHPLRNLLPAVSLNTKPDHAGKGLSQIIRRRTGAKFDAVAKEAFNKKRNAMYARRSVQKAKLQHISLQDQKAMLESQNRILAADNKKLEMLLARAKLEVSIAELRNPHEQACNSVFVG